MDGTVATEEAPSPGPTAEKVRTSRSAITKVDIEGCRLHERVHFKLQAVVRVTHPGCTNTLDIVREAEGEVGNYDRIYCVVGTNTSWFGWLSERPESR